MYGKELIVVSILMVMTALPAVAGLRSPFFDDLPLIQSHLGILVFIYLLLFHIGSIFSYETYSRYRKPTLLWEIYDKMKSKKRRKEIDKSLEDGAIYIYKIKLIDLAFDDINSNEIAKKEIGLIQIRELFSDPGISPEQKRKIIKNMLESIERESTNSFKIKLMRELSNFVDITKQDNLLLDLN